MAEINVKKLAEMAGVTIRTLRYYDKIGLLKPERQSDNNYRVYSEEDCLRLQQILLYRELEIPLETIKELLDDSGFDSVTALKNHRNVLSDKKKRINTILQTVDRTIKAIERKTKIMDYKDLYEGFGKENAEAYSTEAKERWGTEIVDQSHEKLMKLSKKEWNDLIEEGKTITRELAKRSHLPADESSVQEWIARHFTHLRKHFAITKEIYSNMGKMYAEDERFRAYYEEFSPNLADFMNKAIETFCK